MRVKAERGHMERNARLSELDAALVAAVGAGAWGGRRSPVALGFSAHAYNGDAHVHNLMWNLRNTTRRRNNKWTAENRGPIAQLPGSSQPTWLPSS
jgi:hypothetical protein